MSTVINKLSHLMPKLRFDELQNVARQICYRYFDEDGDFTQIAEDVEDALNFTSDEYIEQEKMLLHFLVFRNIQLYGKGEELTDLPWASHGYMGTAGAGDTIQ